MTQLGSRPPAQPRNTHPDDHFRLETLNSLFYTDTITVKAVVAEDGGEWGGRRVLNPVRGREEDAIGNEASLCASV